MRYHKCGRGPFLGRHRLSVIGGQNLIVACAVVDGIVIKRIRPTRERGPKLPHHVPRHARVAHHRALPRPHNAHSVLPLRNRVFFEEDGLPDLLANGVVLADPRVPPGVIVSPLVGVEMEGAEVDRRYRQDGLEIDALVAGVRVAVFEVGEVGRSRSEPALVTNGHEVFAVERFDIGACVGGPFGDDAGVAAGAARFVAEFPAEDRGA